MLVYVRLVQLFTTVLLQGFPGEPGLPGPEYFHNGSDARGENKSICSRTFCVVKFNNLHLYKIRAINVNNNCGASFHL